MANITEIGQAASEVQFQDEVGKLKNRQGEACLEVTDDQNVGIGTDAPTSPNGNATCLEIKGASVGLVLDSTNGSAGNFEMQHNGGDLKILRETTAGFHMNASAEVDIPVGLTYKSKATVDGTTGGTDVELVDSGTSFVLTDKDGYCTLPVGTASDIGVQFVIFNASDDDNPDCIRRGGSDEFFHADEVAGTGDNQEVGAMKAKTVICFDLNSWIVIG